MNEIDQLQAENAELHRYHAEDRTALTEMRATIERLRGELEIMYGGAFDTLTSAPVLTPYRRLLARLEADRAGHLRAAGQTTDETLRTAGSSYAAALHHAAVAAVAEFEGAEAAQAYAQRTSGGEGDAGDSLDSAELTAEEARDLAADLGLELYRAQDALAFVEECCVIADREGRTVTTAAVRKWLKGARCGRQLTADANLEKSAAEFKSGAATLNSPADTDLRNRIAQALEEADYRMDMRRGDLADAVLAVLPAPADRAAVLRDADELAELDREGTELVCVDLCGSCDACGMEPFGTPAEGWREAARFLRRTPRDSADFLGAIRGARLIEDELRRLADEAQQAGRAEVEPMNPVHILDIDSEDQDEAAALRARLLARLTEARANETGKDKVRCTCGGWFPIRHLHADTHQPAAEAQPAGEAR